MLTIAQSIISDCIDEVNQDLEGDLIIGKLPETKLLGADSAVDSLALVRLLVTIERMVEERTGKAIVIVDESTFEAETSPFATVKSLVGHVQKLIAV